MAEQSKPISGFGETTSLPIGSLFFASLEDIDSETGYASYYVKTETIAAAMATQYTFSGLETSAKTLVGAINELTGGSGGATVYVGTTDPTSDIGENGNLYAKYIAGTPPTVSAFYVKINGSWASISTGGGGLIGVEMTQAEYDALTPEEKINGTVYFITDTSIPSVLEDYQTREDDSLDTTSQEVVGAINELNGLIATAQGLITALQSSVSALQSDKQNVNDNNLSTTVKTIVGAINQLNSYKVSAVNMPSIQGNNFTTLMTNLLNYYENSIGAQEVRFVRFIPSYYDTYFKGFAQVAICYKNGTNAYHTYLPTVGMSSYYYDNNWHWQQESRQNVTPS